MVLGILGIPILLRKWVKSIVSETFMLDRVSIWVKLFCFPLKLWTHRGLCVVASVVGRQFIWIRLLTKVKIVFCRSLC